MGRDVARREVRVVHEPAAHAEATAKPQELFEHRPDPRALGILEHPDERVGADQEGGRESGWPCRGRAEPSVNSRSYPIEHSASRLLVSSGPRAHVQKALERRGQGRRETKPMPVGTA